MKKREIQTNWKVHGSSLEITSIAHENFDIFDLLPNNLGDRLCEGITEDTEEEGSHPDYYAALF